MIWESEVNRTSERFSVAAALSILLAGLVACGGSDIEPEPPDLSGSWELNEARSDLMGNEMQDQMIGGAAPGRRPEGAEGSGRRGGGGRGGRGGFNPEQMRQRMQTLMEAARAFEVIQTDSTILLASKSGPSRLMFTDGRKIKQQMPGGTEVETKARWKDGVLLVERKFGDLKIKETYQRSEDGERLVVHLELSGGMLPRALKARRVYTNVEEGEKVAGEEG